MKHVDLTRYRILDIEQQGIKILRLCVSVGPHECELCGGHAEYTLRSALDRLGQCDVYECQACILESVQGFHSVDRLVLV